ncbi:hypothetical protein PZ938_18085 [Luteipulveratus sp. YIM 133132]|uniref:hypothetical protein n=1 Tax=Luteipulveratus flavus TaxID=3031728 RepID=UPI0023AE96B1|nr:hypothetical protein [Luteipulveratus sp. YIM 133132]MDE9367532.1 hypothetical protein [Luteipulveratus sp. YIM 133132]
MRLPQLRRSNALPEDVREALELDRGERVVASATDDKTDATVVATTTHLVVVGPAGQVTTRRPWHLVDAGQWNADTWTLSVTWVDKARPGQWTFRDQDTRLLQAFRERVEATVVVTEPLGLTGAGRAGRVVLRKDLSTQQLLVQPVLGRGTRADDPVVRAAVERATARLEEQAGL